MNPAVVPSGGGINTHSISLRITLPELGFPLPACCIALWNVKEANPPPTINEYRSNIFKSKSVAAEAGSYLWKYAALPLSGK